MRSHCSTNLQIGNSLCRSGFRILFINSFESYVFIQNREQPFICKFIFKLFIQLILNSVIIYLGILGGIIAYEYEDHIVIISTAFIGSYTFIRALSIPIGHFPNEFQFSQNIKNGSLKFSWTVILTERSGYI